MKVIVNTQYAENYGFAEGNDYWKFKGGTDYVIAKDIHEFNETVQARIDALIQKAKEELEYSNPASSVEIVDWDVVEDGWMSALDESAIEYGEEPFTKDISERFTF